MKRKMQLGGNKGSQVCDCIDCAKAWRVEHAEWIANWQRTMGSKIDCDLGKIVATLPEKQKVNFIELYIIINHTTSKK